MKQLGRSLRLAGLLVVLCAYPAMALDVTLDSGSGSTTLTDDDLDGIIDFDVTVGGVFEARGRVFEQFYANNRIVSVTSTPPLTEGVFHNVGVTDATFTVTVNSTAFDTLGPPLAWAIYYNGHADDALAAAVNIPSNSVQALVNAGALSLTTLAGPALIAAGDIDVTTSGLNAADSAADLRVVFSFTVGPDDEILLPDNNGVDAKAIQVSVFNQEFKCIDKMNNLSRSVLDKAQKSDATCVNDAVKAGGGDATACVDDPAEPKTDKAEAKVIDQFNTLCELNLPPWGVNGGNCCDGGTDDGDACLIDATCTGGTCVRGACMSGAAERAANDATHGLFGGTVSPTTDETGKCQSAISKLAGGLLVERWKVFRKCKKDNFSAIADDAQLVATCLGPPQTDPKAKIDKRETKIADQVAKCIAQGVTPVGPAFPGDCTAAADGAIATCISQLMSCRFCEAINVADDIEPPLDCDLFDDGVTNASCP